MPLPKVVLRDLIMEDAEDRYTWSLDREITKYLSFPDKYPPFTMDETKKWVKICMEGTNGYFQKTILAEDGKPIGWVDLKNIDNINKNAEMGIAIGDRNYLGKGYGSAAIYEILRIGFLEFGLNKIWLRVDFDNTSATNCYERCRFKLDGIMRQDRRRRGRFIARYYMSMLKEDYLKLR